MAAQKENEVGKIELGESSGIPIPLDAAPGQPVVDGESQQAKPEVKVAQEHCWVDESPELCEVEYGGNIFKMRAISAGDMQQIYAALNVSAASKDIISPEELGSRIDIFELQILTVAHALGVFNPLCGEGWLPTGVYDPTEVRKVTIENVRLFTQKLLVLLSEKHREFFRTNPGDSEEPRQDD